MFAFLLNQTTRHRLLVCLLLLTGLLGARAGVFPASAQQPDPADTDTTARDTTRSGASAERKSPGRALLYSLGGTAVLTPVAGIGLLFGLAFGHYYAGNSQQAQMGIYIRSGGGLLALTSAATVNQLGFTRKAGITLGVLTIIGSAVYDVVTAPRAAREYNEAHGLSARVTPAVGPRCEQVGVSLRVSFY